MENIDTYLYLTNLKFRKMMSFKTELIIQIIGMILNNLAFFSIWYLLLLRFGSINGYKLEDFLLLEGSLATVYAIYFLLFGGVTKLYQFLNQDSFLDMQLYPASPLAVTLTKSGASSQFGDLIQGVLFLGYYGFLYTDKIGMMIIGLILILVGFFGIMLFVNSFAFFYPGLSLVFEDIFNNVYISASMYPSDNYKGVLRNILFILLVIPVICFPIEVVRGLYGPEALLISLFCVIGINILGYLLWHAGIRKAESGSSRSMIV
ncbi:MAG: hypothetical protein WCO06_04285 [Candidatus Roizmanbacteria bacterium]